MSDEKQNNSWQHKLEELDQLPGTEWRKDAAWDKLYTRLQEKPRRKKTIWYMTAAACLLIAVVIAWMVMNPPKNELAIKPALKRNQPGVTKTLPQQPVRSTIQSPPVISLQDRLQVKPVSAKEYTDQRQRKINTGVYLTRISTMVKSSLPVNDDVQHDTTTIVRLPVTLPVPQAVIIAAAPAKKKLKMVHLNELGFPMEDNSKMVRSANWHSFQIKFNGPDPFAQPFTSQEGNGPIKIKVPSQN